MSASNPITQRCTAHSKSSGQRCKQWVRGGGVCPSHGQSKKVKAAQEARAMAMEAELKAARNSEPYEPRHPGEVLMSAVAASDVLLSYLLQRRAAGELTVEESTALGWAIDRAARTSKTELDANVAERMVELKQQRLEWHAKDRAEQMWGILVATVKAAPLSAQDRLLVWNSLGAGVRAIQDEREPAHLAGDELHGVTARLELEAREEAAAAELVVWDDSDFDSDDVGSPLSLVSTHGDGAAL